MKTRMRVLAASLLIALSPIALADDEGALGTQSSTQHGQSEAAGKIASEFTRLAGSRSNALALVNGLRNGTPITLTTKVPPATTGTTGTGTGTTGTTGTGTGTTGTGTSTTTTTTITPPTGRMGFGEVKIALALAEDSLRQAGITKPTAAQLQAALDGGDVTVKHADGTTTTTTLKGVLAMRASGMGWGQIAKADGTTVGRALHNAKAEPHELVKGDHDDGPKGSKSAKVEPPKTAKVEPSKTAATGTTKSAAVSPSKGITTAAGAPSATPHGKGVVTGAGGSATTVASSGGGKGPSGVVTGTGANASSGVTTANGHGGGDGKGSEHKGKGSG